MNNILITGAAGNLGRAVTGKFLKEGFQVHAIIEPVGDPDLKQNEKLQVYRCDLEKEADAATVVGKIAAGGKIDMAVMTAGGFAMGNLAETTVGDLEKMYRLNFVTAYNVARPLFGYMEKQGTGGRIVFIGARPGLDPGAGKSMIAYTLSKSLLFSLSEIINQSGKNTGITSAVIVPSTIDTPANRKAMPEADPTRWVTPQAIADNIYHLATPSGSVLRETILKVYNNA
jgi:NAD(P)-dependent dehydrogenase (short-subunit alcohol dehydrogenase family)